MSDLSYHDLHITTRDIPRTALTDLPYRVQVTCSRVAGWRVVAFAERGLPEEILGGEYDGGLILDVAGYVIVDTLTRKLEEVE